MRVVVEWDGGGIEKVFLWGFALLCKVGYFGGKMGGVVGGGGGKFGSEIGFITRWLYLVFGAWCLGIKNPRPGKEKKTGRGLRLINEL